MLNRTTIGVDHLGTPALPWSSLQLDLVDPNPLKENSFYSMKYESCCFSLMGLNALRNSPFVKAHA